MNLVQSAGIQFMALLLVILNFFPHMSEFPIVLTLGISILFVWKTMHLLKGWPLPKRWHCNLAAALAPLVVLFVNDWTFSTEMSIQLLVVLSVMKVLETHTYRDTMFLTIAMYLTLMGYILQSQTLASTVFMTMDVLIITSFMYYAQNSRFSMSEVSIRPALRMLALTLPIWISLFVLFPRFNGSFWSFRSQKTNAGGFSESVDPSQTDEISLSSEVQFHVTFSGPVPHPEALYFRAGFLDTNQELRWLVGVPPKQKIVYDASQINTPQIRYEIVSEASHDRILFPIDFPDSLTAVDNYWQRRIESPTVGTFRTSMPVHKAIYLIGQSGNPPKQEWNQTLEKFYTQYPAPSQRLAQWIKEFEKQNQKKPIVDSLLDFYATGGFSYTLSPGRMQNPSVEEFIFSHKRGFCEHFAASFAYLLRALGEPARVVIGYQGGQLNPITQSISVREKDAHAWVEYFDRNQARWTRIDPTRVVAPLRIQMGGDFLDLAQQQKKFGREFLQRWILKGQQVWDAASMTWTQFLLSYDSVSQSSFLQSLGLEVGPSTLLAILALIVLICGWIIRHILERQKRADEKTRLFTTMCQILQQKGIERDPFNGPETLRAKCTNLPEQLRDASWRALDIYQDLTYQHPDLQRYQIRDLKAAVINLRQKSREQTLL